MVLGRGLKGSINCSSAPALHGLGTSSAFFHVSLSTFLPTFPGTLTELTLYHRLPPESSHPCSSVYSLVQSLLRHFLKGYLRSSHLVEVRGGCGVGSGSRALCWLGLPRRPVGEALLTHTLQEAGVNYYILTPWAEKNWERTFLVFIHIVLGLIREQLIWANLQSFHLIQI